jgi:hypothetical protein
VTQVIEAATHEPAEMESNSANTSFKTIPPKLKYMHNITLQSMSEILTTN